MIPLDFFLLYIVLVLIAGAGVSWFIVRRYRQKLDVRDDPDRPLKQVNGILSDIKNAVAAHGKKVRELGKLFATDSESGSVNSQAGEESLSDFRKVNRSFIDGTQENVERLRVLSAESEFEITRLRSRLLTHLNNSKELDPILVLCTHAESAIREREVLLNTIEVLLESERMTDAALAATQKRLAEREAQLEEARFEARHDELTQLPNRRALNEQIAALNRQFRGQEHLLFCILIEIDSLKTVDDEYGHTAGDAMLTVFSRVLCETVRAKDKLFRFSSDKFLILLPGQNAQHAVIVADRLAEKIKQVTVLFKDHELSFTISMGIAEHFEGKSCEEFLDRADVALRSAKRSGRNQICVHGEHSEALLRAT